MNADILIITTVLLCLVSYYKRDSKLVIFPNILKEMSLFSNILSFPDDLRWWSVMKVEYFCKPFNEFYR